jgi:basic amino acid/polyamine antiporter, APA family
MSEHKLNRTLGLPLLVLYGLGTVVGAGIYAVIGEVAANAGVYTPFAFLMASVMALFSAMSLAELSARYPKSAGEAVFVREGFGMPGLSTLVGLLVILSGIVSAATIVNGAVGYVQQLVALDRVIIVSGLVLILAAIASLGVGQSVGIAAIISIIEVAGLIIVIVAGRGELVHLPEVFASAPPLDSSILTGGILGGALLAFYAFIGFEDMVNMAEEVKNPVRTMPRAILLVLALSSVIYVLLAFVMVASMDMESLRNSSAPLADVFSQTSGLHGGYISAIGILAIINGGLVQIIMGARVIYGLTQQGSLPKVLGRLNPKTKTPVIATILVGAIVLTLAVVGSLGSLASVTSMLLLTVFTLVNLALLRIKAQRPSPEGAPDYPKIIPLLGALISGSFVLWKLVDLF